MGTFSGLHWLIVLVVVVLLFGTKKLRGLGGDLGAAIKGFKQGIKDDGTKTLEAAAEEPSATEKTDSRDHSV